MSVVLAMGVLLCLLAWPAWGWAGAPNTITIGAASPYVSNCFPFGGFLADGGWGPYFAFVYKDIPPFHLRPGDVVAFDLGVPNDTDNRMDIAMAPTTANGNDVNNGAFMTIATNAQTPANPRGDSTAGNYELQWTASSAFDFAGGGLIIRFSNPAGSFATDATCDAQVVLTNSGDASGFFVGRSVHDADGVSPWDNFGAVAIGQFRVILEPTPGSFTFGKVKRNTHRGTAELPIQVQGPGILTVRGNGVKAQTAASERAQTSVASAGTVELAIKPRGKLKRKLILRHRTKVPVTVMFTPSPTPDHQAGDPSTQSKTIKLVRR